MTILKTTELYTLNGQIVCDVNYVSIKLLLNHRNGGLELPAEVEVVGWAQWEQCWGCYPATGPGGTSGRMGARMCHLSLTGTNMLICLGGAGNSLEERWLTGTEGSYTNLQQAGRGLVF